jgi:predicted alpha/beta hydrolase
LPALADELHFAHTPDGWRLALHRHAAGPPELGLPVILCPGYACNRHFIDWDAEYSLARFLARRGFDAWVIELRGRGLSHPTPACAAPRTWTFDDLALHDVPTAVRHVARMTRRRVAWVGHSMGGMLLYASLGGPGGAELPIVAGVTLAAPVAFPPVSSELLARLGRLLLDVALTETIHQRLALGVLWQLVGRTAALGIGMNPANVDRRVVGAALQHALCNVSRAKLRQLSDWSLTGRFASVDGRVDYRAALAHITTPLLVVAGTADRLATPATVERALAHLPPRTATYLEAGRGQGFSVDYGHVDLVLGRAAPAEIFPAIADWLARHEGTP